MSNKLTEAGAAELELGWLARCDWCGWPIGDRSQGCAEFDCSQRPMPSNDMTRWRVAVRSLLYERKATAEALRVAREALEKIGGESTGDPWLVARAALARIEEASDG